MVMTEVSTTDRYTYPDLPALMALMSGDEKHDPASESTLDVIWVLYDRVLRISQASAAREPRDRFYLSKGHGPMAYYATLTAKGFIEADELPRYGQVGSLLGQHPDRNLVPGAEISSGSLGHGLPLAVGTALGLRALGLTEDRVFVLTGDGELDEGSGHEAIAFAGRAGLEALHCVVVDNGSASYGWPGGIETRFAAEGWSTARVDGHDHDALETAFTAPHPGRPLAVIAVIGRG
jgi:transketolase